MTRVAFAVFMGMAWISGAAVAACPDPQPTVHQAKKRLQDESCVNLSALPQISDQVAAAASPPAVKRPAYTPPTPTKYEGPTLGMSKPEPGVRAVPTVGYHWNLQ